MRKSIRLLSLVSVKSDTFVEYKITRKMKTINTRRTIRKYATREVENELLHRLLAPAHFCQPMVTEAPVVLTFCADTRRTTKWAECRDANPGFSNFLSFMNGATDALLYCQTFCNLAEEEGLGCCFLGTTVYSPQTITLRSVCRLRLSCMRRSIMTTPRNSSIASTRRRSRCLRTAASLR